ncbi:MAG: DUF3450 domain-containing protein [Halomonas subglaciescola]|nr:DUF3450 domain-containing protein [Halomonas subglaciescola]
MSIPFRTAAYGWVMAGSMALLPASTAFAADSQASDGVKAQRTQAALQGQIDQADSQTQGALTELRKLEGETRTLRHQNDRRTRKLAGEARRQRELTAALDTLEQTRKALPRIEDAMARQLEGFIKQDMPFLEQERLARVKPGADTLDSTAHIRQLLKAWRMELDYGREVDRWRGRLTQADGAERDVDFLRLGRIGWYYLTPDGRKGGVWQTDTREWQPLDETQRREVRHGLQIANDQRAPELLAVPLSIKVADAENSRKASGGEQ